ILIPRISLTNISLASPVTSPATGLLIWNTNAALVGGSGIGFYYWDGTLWQAVLSDAKGWKLNGNSGTGTATQFIGTSDNLPLNIRLNNDRFGKLDHIKANVFFGKGTGMNTSGSGVIGANNFFLGDSAGFHNTAGFLNTFIGLRAGYNNLGGDNNIF